MKNKEIYISAFLTIALATLAVSAFAPVFAVAQVDPNSSKLPSELTSKIKDNNPHLSAPVVTTYKVTDKQVTNISPPMIERSQRTDYAWDNDLSPDGHTCLINELTGYYPTAPEEPYDAYTAGYWCAYINILSSGGYQPIGWIWLHWWTNLQDTAPNGAWLQTISYSAYAGVWPATQLFNYAGTYAVNGGNYVYLQVAIMVQGTLP